MIRITKSNVLWFDGRRTHLMPAGSEFRADDALEARWVAEGVAEHVDGGAPATAPVEPAPDAEPAPDLADMTKAELVRLAESRGVVVGRMTKAQLVKAIEASDEPPAINAAEVE